MKLIKYLVFLFASFLITGCGLSINSADISVFDYTVNDIKLDNTGNKFNSVSPVIQQNSNGGLSRIIQRKNKEFIIVYGSESYGDKHIYLTSSKDAILWSTAKKITNGSLTDSNPTIIEDKQENLRVFYSSNQNGDWEILQIISKDGKEWSKPASIPLDYQGVYNPHVIQSKTGEFILVYQASGNGIFVSRSKDGKEWVSSQVSPEGKAPFIQILNNGSYTTVYENEKNIFLRESNDLSNWSDPKKLTDFSNVKNPALSITGDKILLSFTARDTNNNWNIYTQKTSDLDNWSEAIKLTSNTFQNTRPSIFSNKNMSILSWTVENSAFSTKNNVPSGKTIYAGALTL